MVTLEQYKKALGKKADGLFEAELQQRLDHTARMAEAFYEWWHKRKDYGCEALGGKYSIDVVADLERLEREAALGGLGEKQVILDEGDGWIAVPYQIVHDENFMRNVKELWKMKKQSRLQS